MTDSDYTIRTTLTDKRKLNIVKRARQAKRDLDKIGTSLSRAYEFAAGDKDSIFIQLALMQMQQVKERIEVIVMKYNQQVTSNPFQP